MVRLWQAGPLGAHTSTNSIGGEVTEWLTQSQVESRDLNCGICRRKMRMPCLCKVEMSALMDVRGRHGDGVNRTLYQDAMACFKAEYPSSTG